MSIRHPHFCFLQEKNAVKICLREIICLPLHPKKHRKGIISKIENRIFKWNRKMEMRIVMKNINC